jgi:hypothetical protein
MTADLAAVAAMMRLPPMYLDHIGLSDTPEEAIAKWRALLPQVKRLCRSAVSVHHPDAGGSHKSFLEATRAREYATCSDFPRDLWQAYTPQRDRDTLPLGVFEMRDPAFLRRQ